MTRNLPRTRAGITLTEILISILIMGIGLISLASLFPVGLERLRQGQRAMRSALLAGGATADVQAKNLLNANSFLGMTWYLAYDPWIQDYDGTRGAPAQGSAPIPAYLVDPLNAVVPPNTAVYRGWGYRGTPHMQPLQAARFRPGSGLPVAYDPLWWDTVNRQIPTLTPSSSPAESRFGRGVAFVGRDPDGGIASAHGLQRITNLVLGTTASQQLAFQTFVSADDPVLQQEGESNPALSTGSPILPAINPVTGNIDYDYTFSWMFTGRRADVTNGAVYIGDIVVFHNRQFGFDASPSLGTGTTNVPAGERAVEAVFGYGTTVQMPLSTGAVSTTVGYSPNRRTVLLRWPSTLPDPEVKVGGWIADVTYEVDFARDVARFQSVAAVTGSLEIYPGQRCHWYRVTRRTDIEDETPGTTTPPAASGYRRVVVTIDTPVQSRTLLSAGGSPVHTNVALICPNVVNVFPKVFTTR